MFFFTSSLKSTSHFFLLSVQMDLVNREVRVDIYVNLKVLHDLRIFC